MCRQLYSINDTKEIAKAIRAANSINSGYMTARTAIIADETAKTLFIFIVSVPCSEVVESLFVSTNRSIMLFFNSEYLRSKCGFFADCMRFMAKSFGQLTGELILRKRKALGLTQLQLSEDAFDTAAKVRRISELENGTVSNPHPKTIDPLLVTLGISDAEIEKCAEEANYRPDETLTEAYSHIESTLQRISEQFDSQNPLSTFDELTKFLESKAKEFVDLKRQMKTLLGNSEGVTQSIEIAVSQIESGDIDRAIDTLATAEAAQFNNQTIEQIRKQADISIARGNCAFLQDDLALCYQCYERAALYFSHFDKLEMIDLFSNLAGMVYEGSRRSAYPRFWISVDLLRRCIREIEGVEFEHAVLAGLNHKLSMVLRNHSFDVNDDEKWETLESSVYHAREAVREFSQGEDDIDHDLPSAQVALANSLLDLSKLSHDPSHIDSAIETLTIAYDRLEEFSENKPIFAYVANSLGAAILKKHDLQQDSAPIEAIERAKAVFSASEICARNNLDREAYISASINLGRIFFDQSQLLEKKSDDSDFLRLLAISKFKQCIEFFSKTRFPYQLAESHFLLAEVLYVHALYSDEEMYEIYSMRCLDAYFQSLEFITLEDEPDRYAYIKCRIGGVYGNHSVRVKGETERYDLEKAIECFEEAKVVYVNTGDKERLESCVSNLKGLEEEIRKLDEDPA